MSEEMLLPLADLAEAVRLLGELGFRLDGLFPADDPAVAVVSGFGVRLRVERDAASGEVRLRELDGDEGVAPAAWPQLQPAFVLARAEGAPWVVGRAGMRYRDLIPGRQGGRFIASHIRIDDGGPVPDWVHFHEVRLQMIYCWRGWVRVVYEDQGEPFVLAAGDAVLQPPRIRHRVLECSPGLEVIEVSSPAVHPTWADHDLGLPTQALRPERDFAGQRFVRHQAVAAPPGDVRDLGIAAATGGVAAARVRRLRDGASLALGEHAGELRLLVALDGDGGRLRRAGEQQAFAAGDAVVVPAGDDALLAVAAGHAPLDVLEVTLPA